MDSVGISVDFSLCVPAAPPLVVPVATAPFSNVNLVGEAVFSYSVCESVEPQTFSLRKPRSECGFGVWERDASWSTARQTCARSGHKQTHAAKFGVQSGTRMYAKQSTASRSVDRTPTHNTHLCSAVCFLSAIR